MICWCMITTIRNITNSIDCISSCIIIMNILFRFFWKKTFVSQTNWTIIKAMKSIIWWTSMYCLSWYSWWTAWSIFIFLITLINMEIFFLAISHTNMMILSMSTMICWRYWFSIAMTNFTLTNNTLFSWFFMNTRSCLLTKAKKFKQINIYNLH